MKILFITQDDPFYIRFFFEEFFGHKPTSLDIAGVVICPTMGKKSAAALARQMFDFYGPYDFIRMCWRYALTRITGTTLHNACRKYGISVYEERNINGAAFIDAWKDTGIDLIVSVAAPVRFGRNLLALPRQGSINVHHAPLPRYRGMMPNFWQVFHGEKSVWITVHRVNEQLDEGEIILQREIPLEPQETLDHLMRRTKRLGAECIREAIEAIATGSAQYLPNKTQEGSYFSFPEKQDAREFRKKGHRLL